MLKSSIPSHKFFANWRFLVSDFILLKDQNFSTKRKVFERLKFSPPPLSLSQHGGNKAAVDKKTSFTTLLRPRTAAHMYRITGYVIANGPLCI